MPYYLIKQWTPHRGETRDNPGCYWGPGYSGEKMPEQIRSDACYSSLKRAENVKARRYNIYSPAEVVQVPAEIVTRFVKVPEVPYHIKAGSRDDAVTCVLSGEKTCWARRIDALVFYDGMRTQAWRDNNSDLSRRLDHIIANLAEGNTVCPDNQLIRFTR